MSADELTTPGPATTPGTTPNRPSREELLQEFRAAQSADRLCNSRRFGYGCRCGLLKGHRGECQCPHHGERWPFSRW